MSVAAVLTSMLLGCASLPKAAPQFDWAAKQFDAVPGVARIYVYRLGSVFYARYDSRIRIADEYIGRVSKHLFVFADVPPGRHVVSATTVLVEGEGSRDLASADVAVDAEPGGLYFVRVEVPTTWPVDPPKIQLVQRSEGIPAVQRCQLAELAR